MKELIWQTAAGGLLYAVRQLKSRCDITIPGMTLSETAAVCLESAADLVASGKNPATGTEALACIFDHLDGSPLSRSVSNPWAAMDGHWESACPDDDFGSRLNTDLYQTNVQSFCKQLGQSLEKKDFAAMDRLCGNILSFLPLMPGDSDDGDISLYDFLKEYFFIPSCFSSFKSKFLIFLLECITSTLNITFVNIKKIIKKNIVIIIKCLENLIFLFIFISPKTSNSVIS